MGSSIMVHSFVHHPLPIVLPMSFHLQIGIFVQPFDGIAFDCKKKACDERSVGPNVRRFSYVEKRCGRNEMELYESELETSEL